MAKPELVDVKLIAIGPARDKLNSNKSQLQWETDFSNPVVNSGKKGAGLNRRLGG